MRYCPEAPTEKQTEFISLECLEAFFGGAAGGGKSSALLMGALQYIDQQDYAAIIFRRTYADLSLPGGLMDRAAEWLGGTDAKWNGTDHRWTFPSGATLSFGYLETENDKFRYGSSEFQFIGFDELSTFAESPYRFLFSRLRRRTESKIPLRMRAASNPGGIGHGWVKQRFLVEGQREGRVFIPAKLGDNPHVDQEQYLQSLNQLDPITRAQLLSGDWDVREEGMFRRIWFTISDDCPANALRVRAWDLAATAKGDWTVGVLISRDKDGTFWVEHVVRGRWTPFERDGVIHQTAKGDGLGVRILFEEEGGSSGKMQSASLLRMLAGFAVADPVRPTGDKATRAQPFASQAGGGMVRLKRGDWNTGWIDEHCSFMPGVREQVDDQVDATAYAFNWLASQTAPQRTLAGPPRPAIANYRGY